VQHRFLELIRRTNVFVALRKKMLLLSGALTLVTVVSIALHGWRLNLGIDFAGGTMVHVSSHSRRPSRTSAPRSIVRSCARDGPGRGAGRRRVPGPVQAGEGADSAAVADAIKTVCATSSAREHDVLRVESVGPKVGKDLS
jgi:preprotein translocase subunit SecF